jgi:hypothetical protein
MVCGVSLQRIVSGLVLSLRMHYGKKRIPKTAFLGITLARSSELKEESPGSS